MQRVGYSPILDCFPRCVVSIESPALYRSREPWAITCSCASGGLLERGSSSFESESLLDTVQWAVIALPFLWSFSRNNTSGRTGLRDRNHLCALRLLDAARQRNLAGPSSATSHSLQEIHGRVSDCPGGRRAWEPRSKLLPVPSLPRHHWQ